MAGSARDYPPKRADENLVKGQPSPASSAQDSLPTGRHKDVLLAFREKLEESSTWEAWCSNSPLMLTLDPDRLRPQSFDEDLRKYLWHVETISHKPHTHLKIEIERVPVHRLRRMPTRAFDYLASHTEDWAWRKVNSVVPRRVLSTEPDDLYDLYENRLAARLIFEIEHYLQQRLQIEEEALSSYKEYTDQIGLLSRMKRVYELWGQIFVKQQQSEEYTRLREFHRELQTRVRRLFDDVLYRAIPRYARQSVPKTLRITNILTHDRHYRYANELWKKWLERPENRPKSAEELEQENRQMREGFERYCVLVLVRALEQIRFEPVHGERSELLKGAALRLSHKALDKGLRLSWNDTALNLIDEEGTSLLQVIPTFRALTAGSNSEVEAQLNEAAAQLESEHASQAQVILVYPGMPEERQQLSDHLKLQVNSPIGCDERKGIGFVPVFAYDPNSVERLGRAVRWAIWKRLLLAYPPKVAIPRAVRNGILSATADWLSGVPDARDDAELQQLPSADQLRRLEAELHALHSKYTRSGKEKTAEKERLTRFEDDLDSARDRLRKLLICPVCFRSRDERFFSRRGDGFECFCEDCNASWGINRCGNCGGLYPFIAHEKVKLKETHGLSDPDWVERHFGMDILAQPCLTNGVSKFVCPYCNAS